MQGMLSQLDDYSVYITPANRDKFYETIDQQFAGVGMEVALDPETKQLRVLSPVFGSPAYRAGILAGDRILRIGKPSAQGMSLQDAVGLIRGTPGEPVTLTIQHEGSKEPVEVTIVRAIVHEPTVLGDTRNPDGSWNFFLEGHDRIGYLRITSFTDDTPAELKDALEWLTARDMRGLVLDLRDDPGGYLTAAVDVCDLLVRSGVIVTTRRRGGRVEPHLPGQRQRPLHRFPHRGRGQPGDRQRGGDRRRLPPGPSPGGGRRPADLRQRDRAGGDRPAAGLRGDEVHHVELLAAQRQEHPASPRRQRQAAVGRLAGRGLQGRAHAGGVHPLAVVAAEAGRVPAGRAGPQHARARIVRHTECAGYIARRHGRGGSEALCRPSAAAGGGVRREAGGRRNGRRASCAPPFLARSRTT